MGKKMQDYDEFVEKFKPKKTTDDCYTPPLVYDAVLEWARMHLGIGDRPVVRPFWPGGDFEHYDYPEGCVVVDNPPFSIFSRICDWYVGRGIDFLLFAPGLTGIRKNCTFVACGVQVTYENGAVVNTSFVTNMLGDLICTTAPDLRKAVDAADGLNRKQKKTLRKLSFPDCVLRVSTLLTMANAGVEFSVGRAHGAVVGQACEGKKREFGRSVLLSDKATAERLAAERLAAERLAAERLAAERLELSRESMEILERLNSPAK